MLGLQPCTEPRGKEAQHRARRRQEGVAHGSRTDNDVLMDAGNTDNGHTVALASPGQPPCARPCAPILTYLCADAATASATGPPPARRAGICLAMHALMFCLQVCHCRRVACTCHQTCPVKPLAPSGGGRGEPLIKDLRREANLLSRGTRQSSALGLVMQAN